jgi:hypothetical protein
MQRSHRGGLLDDRTRNRGGTLDKGTVQSSLFFVTGLRGSH